jgi:hypothetical protein
MAMKKTLILFLLSLFITSAFSQQATIPENLLSLLLEDMAELGIDPENSEEAEYLVYLSANPLNINAATKEDLEKLFFLGDKQIENLLYHIYQNGPLLSIYELQAIKLYDDKTIAKLIPFISIAPIERASSPFFKGSSLFRYQSLIEKPAGYLQKEDGSPSSYIGSKDKLHGRITLEKNQLSAGFSFEKDQGEPIFNKRIPFTDFYAGYLQYQTPSALKKIVAGTYRLSFGQGSALSTGGAFSGMSNPIGIRKRTKSVSGFNSSDEINYLQGMAAIIEVSKFRLTPFVSYKRIDAEFNSDTTLIESLPQTGYHRTDNELSRRKNTGEWLWGSAFKKSFRQLDVETGWYQYQLELPMQPSSQPYQHYRFTGPSCQNMWAGYTTALNQIMLFGEFTLHNYQKTGVIQGLTWEPDDKLQLAISFRNFDKGYFAPYASPGTYGSQPSGEQNIYIGIKTKPFKRFEIASFHTLFKNQWLTYRADAPSTGQETMLRADWAQKTIAHLIQLRYKQWEQNVPSSGTPEFETGKARQFNIRWQGNYNPFNNWSFITRLEYCQFNLEQSKKSDGILAFQEIRYQSLKGLWHVSFRYLFHNTDNYNSRIYAFEPDVLYGFSVPAFSGNGSRIVVNAKLKIASQWEFWCRFSQSVTYDGETMGSGYDKINQPHRSEVKLQIRHTFSTRKSNPKKTPDNSLE